MSLSFRPTTKKFVDVKFNLFIVFFVCIWFGVNFLPQFLCLMHSPLVSMRYKFGDVVMVVHFIFLVVLQSLPVFIFGNQAGLDMLETTLVALQDITLDKIFDESGRKLLCSEFAKIMQQVFLVKLN